MRPQLTAAELADGVLAGRRTVLAQAITMTESRRADHRRLAAEVLDRVIGSTGSSIRVGITGVPGVGKSTFIDQFGTNLTRAGHRIAVLAVDPSSQRTGGSILGDKTRMERLAVDPDAFIRPSPAGATLGGVTRTTREAMLLCEAAGFDVILVETVGVVQSETIVADMVDFFLVLMLSGAGDELQRPLPRPGQGPAASGRFFEFRQQQAAHGAAGGLRGGGCASQARARRKTRGQARWRTARARQDLRCY